MGDSNGQGSNSGAGGSNRAPSGKQSRPTRCNILKGNGAQVVEVPQADL